MQIQKLVALSVGAIVLLLGQAATAEEQKHPYVRLAELEIETGQLDAFKAAVSEGIEAAIRIEPGVLALYAVSEKDHPNRVRVFEMYTDSQAYQHHLQTPHFRKFRDATARLVRSRKLLDATPIALGAKPRS